MLPASNQDLSILVTSSGDNVLASKALTNNHLKNAIGKSSRSNSIDQLIAAAAVTAHGSTCMSPLSPSNSPTGVHCRASEGALPLGDEAAPSELTVSRKNLNTIVEAIFHVEGASRLDDLVDHGELARQESYQNSLPSSSYTASSSASTPARDQEQTQQQQQQQQQKPPKKRKYTTEDITQTQEEHQQPTVTPTKQSSQFISEYYSSGSKGEQCQSIQRILAQTDLGKGSLQNTSPSKTAKKLSSSGGSSSDENISAKSEQKKSSSNLIGLLITS